MCVCVCVCQVLCVAMLACICVHMWRPEVNTRCLSRYLFSLSFEERLSLYMKLTDSGRLASSPPRFSCLCPPALGLQVHAPPSALLPVKGDHTQVLYACKTNTLITLPCQKVNVIDILEKRHLGKQLRWLFKVSKEKKCVQIKRWKELQKSFWRKHESVCWFLECWQERRLVLAREEDLWNNKKRTHQDESKHNPEVYCVWTCIISSHVKRCWSVYFFVAKTTILNKLIIHIKMLKIFMFIILVWYKIEFNLRNIRGLVLIGCGFGSRQQSIRYTLAFSFPFLFSRKQIMKTYICSLGASDKDI